MRKAGIIILFLLSLPSFANAEVKEDKFVTNYTCFDLKGNERWKGETEISHTDKKDIYILIERGKGYFSGFKGRISWTAKLKFLSTEDRIKPLKMEKQIFNQGGKVIARQTQKFDFANKKVTYRYENLVIKRKMEKVFRFKGDIVNRLVLGLYVQKFLKNGKREQMVSILSDEPRLYRANIKVIGKEEIECNGRKKMAYKLCLDPDIGLLNIFKFILPKVHIWHLATPHYEWLKYVGLESNITSPKVEIRTEDKLSGFDLSISYQKFFRNNKMGDKL